MTKIRGNIVLEGKPINSAYLTDEELLAVQELAYAGLMEDRTHEEIDDSLFRIKNLTARLKLTNKPSPPPLDDHPANDNNEADTVLEDSDQPQPTQLPEESDQSHLPITTEGDSSDNANQAAATYSPSDTWNLRKIVLCAEAILFLGGAIFSSLITDKSSIQPNPIPSPTLSPALEQNVITQPPSYCFSQIPTSGWIQDIPASPVPTVAPSSALTEVPFPLDYFYKKQSIDRKNGISISQNITDVSASPAPTIVPPPTTVSTEMPSPSESLLKLEAPSSELPMDDAQSSPKSMDLNRPQTMQPKNLDATTSPPSDYFNRMRTLTFTVIAAALGAGAFAMETRAARTYEDNIQIDHHVPPEEDLEQEIPADHVDEEEPINPPPLFNRKKIAAIATAILLGGAAIGTYFLKPNAPQQAAISLPAFPSLPPSYSPLPTPTPGLVYDIPSSPVSTNATDVLTNTTNISSSLVNATDAKASEHTKEQEEEVAIGNSASLNKAALALGGVGTLALAGKTISALNAPYVQRIVDNKGRMWKVTIPRIKNFTAPQSLANQLTLYYLNEIPTVNAKDKIDVYLGASATDAINLILKNSGDVVIRTDKFTPIPRSQGIPDRNLIDLHSRIKNLPASAPSPISFSATRLDGPQAPTGLHNPSNYCTLNSAVQILFSFPELKQAFRDSSNETLKKIVEAYDKKEALDLRNLRALFTGPVWGHLQDPNDHGGYQDAHDYLMAILDMLEKDQKFKHDFYVKSLASSDPAAIDNEIDAKEPAFPQMIVYPSDDPNMPLDLQTGIQQFLQHEENFLEIYTKYQTTPKLLLVQVSRLQWGEREPYQPNPIDHLESLIIPQSHILDRQEDVAYTLKSFTVHQYPRPHEISYIADENGYFEINDNQVTLIDEATFFTHARNAHLLFYQESAHPSN